MSPRAMQFIVLALGEKGVKYGVGRDGQGSVVPRPLAELLCSFKADSYDFMRDGCIAYFLRSRRTLRALDALVARAEKLRDTQIAILGIGLAHGRLIGQCDWFGRLKPNFTADPETVNRALAAVQGPQNYRETLEELHGTTD